jgi:hypothetical protein
MARTVTVSVDLGAQSILLHSLARPKSGDSFVLKIFAGGVGLLTLWCERSRRNILIQPEGVVRIVVRFDSNHAVHRSR